MILSDPTLAYEPLSALALYSNGRGQVLLSWKYKDGQPVSMQAPSEAWLAEFLRGVLQQEMVEYLHPRLIARGPGFTAWWRPAQPTTMFFTMPALQELSGQVFPQPPLLFIRRNRAVYIYALPTDERPGPETPLLYAPYPNYQPDTGWVCWGNAPLPQEAAPEAWEEGFFASAFSHILGRVPLKGGNLVTLWQGLAAKQRFPLSRLRKAGKTVGQVLEEVAQRG